MDVARYLERIGYTGDLSPSAANLAALVRAHRLRVPYETLDLWRGVRTTLDLDALYDKIVTRRRGGYCFELNGLFAALLRELGYEVREYAGRWLRNNPDHPVPRYGHRVVCVRLGEGPAKIADVGVGVPFLPAPIDVVLDRPQTQAGCVYRIVRDVGLGYVIEVMNPDCSWLRLCSFDTAPQFPTDFDYPHWWCETHPSSVFSRGFRVFQLTEDGGWRMIRHVSPSCAGAPLSATFVVHQPSGREVEKTISGEANLEAVLASDFGIVTSLQKMVKYERT